MRWRLVAVAAGLVAYGMLVRPCAVSRGAAGGQAGASRPGDGSAARVISDRTRAITFSSSPEQAWPRLVRAGGGRAVAVAMAADGAGVSRSRSVTPPGGPGGGGRRLAVGGWLRARGLSAAGVRRGE